MSQQGAGAEEVAVDPWAGVVASPDVVDRLRRAAANPTHATMLIGPAGHGTRRAAAALAAEILAGQTDDRDQADRHRRLATGDRHPAVTVIERSGASISVDQAREVVRQAASSPVEGSRQVIVLTDMHLAAGAAPMLLKSIEEPPASTFFVVVADDVPSELTTVASRCMCFEFPPVPVQVIVDRLVVEGTAPEVAELAARSSGGDVDRATLLVGDERLETRADFWASVPRRLDTTGATACELVDEARGLVDEVLAPLASAQASEMGVALEDVERSGSPKGAVTELEARHKREQRRVRLDELKSGLAVLVAVYRDAVTDGAPPDRYVDAATRVNDLSSRLVFNPNEELALQSLFARLPRLAG